MCAFSEAARTSDERRGWEAWTAKQGLQQPTGWASGARCARCPSATRSSGRESRPGLTPVPPFALPSGQGHPAGFSRSHGSCAHRPWTGHPSTWLGSPGSGPLCPASQPAVHACGRAAPCPLLLIAALSLTSSYTPKEAFFRSPSLTASGPTLRVGRVPQSLSPLSLPLPDHLRCQDTVGG